MRSSVLWSHLQVCVGSASIRSKIDAAPDNSPAPPITPLLHALASPPDTSSVNLAPISSTHFACLIFAHLLRSSPGAKTSARLIKPNPLHSQTSSDTGQFFVPADGGPPPTAQVQPDDDEPPQTLLQILSENLSLVLLARSRPDASDRENREWDRVVVAYLCLLTQWLWEDPQSVRDFLDAGGLGTVRVSPNSIVNVFSPSLGLVGGTS